MLMAGRSTLCQTLRGGLKPCAIKGKSERQQMKFDNFRKIGVPHLLCCGGDSPLPLDFCAGLGHFLVPHAPDHEHSRSYFVDGEKHLCICACDVMGERDSKPRFNALANLPS